MIPINENGNDDEQFNRPFIWTKKLEKDGLYNLEPQYVTKILQERIRENQVKDLILLRKNVYRLVSDRIKKIRRRTIET